MSQTTIIAGVILFAFVIFITMRGELPKYFAVLGLVSNNATASPGVQTGLSSSALAPFTLSVNQ